MTRQTKLTHPTWKQRNQRQLHKPPPPKTRPQNAHESLLHKHPTPNNHQTNPPPHHKRLRRTTHPYSSRLPPHPVKALNTEQATITPQAASDKPAGPRQKLISGSAKSPGQSTPYYLTKTLKPADHYYKARALWFQ